MPDEQTLARINPLTTNVQLNGVNLAPAKYYKRLIYLTEKISEHQPVEHTAERDKARQEEC